MQKLLRVSAVLLSLATLSTTASAAALRNTQPTVQGVPPGSLRFTTKQEPRVRAVLPVDVAALPTCTAVSKEADAVEADCYALTAALGVATSNLEYAEANLSNAITLYETCVQDPGRDCSVWATAVDYWYGVMAAAEIAYEQALSAWIAGNCNSGLPEE